MTNLAAIASQYIPPPANNYTLEKLDYDTEDIISVIKKNHPKSIKDTKEFAKRIPGASLMDFCANLWSFVKLNIAYKMDPPLTQFVKLPAKVWADKYADCKSYSIFIASVLENRNIPYLYRFTSYSAFPRPTHVYIVVPHNGSQIIMDAVMPAFNMEKPYSFKKDIDMRGLYSVSGIGSDKLVDLGNKDLSQITEGEMNLLIARDRMKTEKDLCEKMRGGPTVKSSRYQDSIDMLEDAIDAINGLGIHGPMDEMAIIANDAVSGVYSWRPEKMSLADWNATRQQRKEERRNGRINGVADWSRVQHSLTGNFLQKAASAVKTAVKSTAKAVVKTATKVATTTAKVLTAPVRLAIKGILEITLPQAAPFFLYLFIPDGDVSKMPAKVRDKRKKQELVAKLIVEVIGMKKEHFMGIVRNGIMKSYGKSPEKVIADMMKKKGIAGIFGIDNNALTSLNQIISQISTIFKKQPYPVHASMAPDTADFPVKQTSTDMPIRTNRPGVTPANQATSSPSSNIPRPATSTVVNRPNVIPANQATSSPSSNIPRPATSTVVNRPNVIPADQSPILPRQIVNPSLPTTASITPNAGAWLSANKSLLQKSGPFFLYLFLNDPNIFAKLPQSVRDKRKRQEEIADYLAKSTGLPPGAFTPLWRDGILAATGKTPEVYLATQLTNAGISGARIGFAIPPQAITAVVQIISKIVQTFKKNKVDVSTNDAAAANDWATLQTTPSSTVNQLTASVLNQESSTATQQQTVPPTNEYTGEEEQSTPNLPARLTVANDAATNFSKGGTSIWDTLK